MLEYLYDSGAPNKLSRASALEFDSTVITEYDYLGLSTPVKVNYPEPDVRYDLATGAGSNPYAGFDRFGRIVDLQWIRELGSSGSGSASSEPLVHLLYGYDQASNRKYRLDEVATDNLKNFDERYGYDSLHRLTSFDRGQLDANGANLTNATLGQTWDLDPTGNWNEFDQSVTGAFNQDRTHNAVNEITSTTETGGVNWSGTQYDDNGNMTRFPRPLVLEGKPFVATYDAWNRMVRITYDDGLVAEYAYDGLHRRTVRDETGGSGDLRHFFYSNRWQVLEEKVEVSSVLQTACQYVWGQRYVDDLVLRDDGSEQVYFLQDANFNVAAVVDDAGDVLERYAYTPYGDVAFLEEDFDAAGSASTIGNNYLYTGRERDPETGLQLNRNRYYHPQLGRWLTRDPIGYAGSEYSLYEYVDGAPLVGTDPTGLKLNVGGDKRFRDYIESLLFELCSLVRVDQNGKVIFLHGPPSPFEQKGCECLAKLINSRKLNDIVISVNPGKQFSEPHIPGDENPVNGFPGLGTGGTVNFNPNLCMEQIVNGKWEKIPSSVVLAHELCGHVVPMNEGMQEKPPREEIFAYSQEDAIRAEQHCPPRNEGNKDERWVPCPYPAATPNPPPTYSARTPCITLLSLSVSRAIAAIAKDFRLAAKSYSSPHKPARIFSALRSSKRRIFQTPIERSKAPASRAAPPGIAPTPLSRNYKSSAFSCWLATMSAMHASPGLSHLGPLRANDKALCRMLCLFRVENMPAGMDRSWPLSLARQILLEFLSNCDLLNYRN